MSGAKDLVDLVVGRHERPRVAVSDRDLEGLEVNLSESSVGNALVDEEPARLLVVGDEVLDASPDALVLDGVDKGAGELSSQEGVFAVGLEVAAA